MRRTVLALVLGALVLSAAPAPGRAAPTAAEDRPLRYVALGDSYSAASGVLPVVVPSPVQCLRSTRNYPHVIAERIDARLTDVTCGAAETRHFRRKQYPDTPPQLDALSRRTELVTMTIGGNDQGVFINAIIKCGVAAVPTLGQGSPCKDQYGRSFVRTIREKTRPAIRRALRAVHRRAPNAEVAILGYPWILPPEDGCYPQVPVAVGDVPYLRRIQRVLNRAVAAGARRTGSTYVDFSGVSEGHDACEAIGTRWIEPAVFGTNPVIIHPNALGERRMARRTIRVMGLGG